MSDPQTSGDDSDFVVISQNLVNRVAPRNPAPSNTTRNRPQGDSASPNPSTNTRRSRSPDRSTAPNSTRRTRSPVQDADPFEALNRNTSNVQSIYQALNLEPSQPSMTTLIPIDKKKINFQGNEYLVNRDYSTDDLVPLQFPGDKPSGNTTVPDPRFLKGPKWQGFSCVLDTVLWIATTCNVRRLRCDFPSHGRPEDESKLSALAQAVTQYLHLPLGALTQDQINRLRNGILTIIRRDGRIGFRSGVGMDSFGCITYAFDPDQGGPFHQFAWTRAMFTGCVKCPAWGLKLVRERIHVNPGSQDQNLQQKLQKYFDPERLRSGSAGICTGCQGHMVSQRVILDRMPAMFLWHPQIAEAGKWAQEVFNPITLLIDIADTIDSGGYIYQPKRMRVTYKPVALGLTANYVSRARGRQDRHTKHAYGASCLPFKDGKGRWLVYDGMRGPDQAGVAQDLVWESDQASLLDNILRRRHVPNFIIMEKQSEERIEWEDRYVETVSSSATRQIIVLDS